MFTDTITLHIEGSDVSFHKINQDKYTSEYLYKDANGEIRLNIRNSSYTDKKRSLRVDRHNMEVVGTIWANGSTIKHDRILKAYGVFECDSDATLLEATDFVPGVFAFFTSANVTKMFNFES